MSPHLYDEHGNLMPAEAPPSRPHDYFGRPLSPDDVERRSRPVSRGYYEDEHERLARLARRTERRRKRDNCRTKIMFVLLGAIASLAGWMSYDAGQDSAAGLEQNAFDAAYASCIAGGELRIAVADGLDSLRRLAVGEGREPSPRVKLFFEQTQPPIDDLLTQAAYDPDSGRRYHVTVPLGEVTPTVIVEVSQLSLGRCLRRTQDQFPGVKPSDER